MSLRFSHAKPGVRDRPALDLLLGQAYQQVNRNIDAARAFQEVYFTFPTATQTKYRRKALSNPSANSSATRYPVPSDEAQTGRVEILFKNSRYQDSLEGFEDLWKAEPASPYAARWQLGQVRCLLRLHRAADALELLSITLRRRTWKRNVYRCSPKRIFNSPTRPHSPWTSPSWKRNTPLRRLMRWRSPPRETSITASSTGKKRRAITSGSRNCSPKVITRATTVGGWLVFLPPA